MRLAGSLPKVLQWPCASKSVLVFVFLLYDQFKTVGALCPSGCTCSEKSVICSCGDNLWGLSHQEPRNSHLKLDAFTGRIDFVNVLIIHSCKSLILPNDTFVGVDILEQLKFIGIESLSIQPHAFRGLRTSPQRLVVQDSHIPILHSHSFEGLKHLDHFWFRNVTIGRIAKMAFSRISDVQYIYFRDAVIGSIESGAFAHMHNITYTYFREKILIKTMGDFVFIGSNIEELVFENSNIQATDLSLVGIRAERIQILHSKWSAKKVQTIRRIPVQHVSEMLIQNTSINRLVLALFYNYTSVLINSAKIVHLQPVPGVVAQNISLLSFTQSTISHWHSHTLASASGIGKLEWCYSSISHIHHHALYSSDINKLNFHNVQITTLSSRAFEQNEVQEMSIVESSVKLFGKMFLGQSDVQNLTIKRLEVGMLEEAAFAALNSSLLSISNSKFDRLPSMLFRESFASPSLFSFNRFVQIDELTIRKCSFNSYAPSNALQNLHANKLLIQSCEFNCSGSTCEENSLLFQSSIHLIAWRFEENSCKFEQPVNGEAAEAKICVQQQELTHRPGVACRRRLEIEECVCMDNSATISYVLDTNATIFILGDCHQVRIQSQNPNSSLQILYLYRITSLEVVSVDKALSQIHILHSHVHFSKPYAFSKMNLHEVSFVNSFVENIAPLTFAWSNIDFFNVNSSTLRQVAKNAFTNSQIQTVELWQTNAIAVGQLFQMAKEVRIEGSFVHDTRGLENVTNLCLRNNSINCRCLLTNEHSNSLAGSICDDPFAQCIESYINRNAVSEFTIQHVNCFSMNENAMIGSYTSSLLPSSTTSKFVTSSFIPILLVILMLCFPIKICLLNLEIRVCL